MKIIRLRYNLIHKYAINFLGVGKGPLYASYVYQSILLQSLMRAAQKRLSTMLFTSWACSCGWPRPAPRQSFAPGSSSAPRSSQPKYSARHGTSGQSGKINFGSKNNTQRPFLYSITIYLRNHSSPDQIACLRYK